MAQTRRSAAWHETHAAVTRMIEAGLPGGRLPAERALAQQLGVSRGLLRRVLEDLAESGRVAVHPQSGWVAESPTTGGRPQRMIGFTEMAQFYGLSLDRTVVASRVRTATLAEATTLWTSTFDQVWDLTRVYHLGNRPMAYCSNVMPVGMVGDLTTTDMTHRSLLRSLEERGVTLGYVDVVVESRAVPAEIAEHLRLQAAAPSLLQSEVAYDARSRPVYIGVSYYRADSYKFHSRLWREGHPAT